MRDSAVPRYESRSFKNSTYHDACILKHLQGTPAAAGKWLQSCLTLCDHTGGSPPGSPVPSSYKAKSEILSLGTSLGVKQLRFCASTERGTGLIPGWGTKIPSALTVDRLLLLLSH